MLWYGVVSARPEGMAPGDAPQAHPGALEQAIPLDGDLRVLRTGWGVTAAWRHPSRGLLIGENHEHAESSSQRSPSSRARLRTSSSISTNFAFVALDRICTTQSNLSSPSRLLIASRKRRFWRFLHAWQPIDLDVAKPTRPIPGRSDSEQYLPREGRPVRKIWSKRAFLGPLTESTSPGPSAADAGARFGRPGSAFARGIHGSSSYVGYWAGRFASFGTDPNSRIRSGQYTPAPAV